MNDEALLSVRRPGARLLVILFWLNVPALAAAGWLSGQTGVAPVALLGAMLCVLPSLLVFGAGRIDAATRMIIGLTAISFPALFVFLARDHLWQMDLHMYFFAALAALAVLCDIRPILAAAAVTALHHLILNYVAPFWVFAGNSDGDLPRVLLHAVIVAMQTAVLLWLTRRLTALILRTAEAARTSEALRMEADAARAKSDEALAALEVAQVAAERQRATEAAVRAADEAAERRRTVADALEKRLGVIVDDLGAMAQALTTSKARLTALFEGTVARSGALRGAHMQAAEDVRAMATDTERLVASIHQVGANAGAARDTARAGAEATEALPPRMEALATTVDAARDILKLISTIAAQSNMLALNATIEAAREEAGGQGFAVVAAEIKTLAAQTARAAAQIAGQLDDIRTAAFSVSGAIELAARSVQSIDSSAAAIAGVVQHQVVATTEIATASEQMAEHIARAGDEAEALARALGEAHGAMDQTGAIASAVSDRSRELGDAVRNLLSELRAA